MALTPPFDILAEWPGWITSIEPMWRQEQSRQANGVTRTKDFGSPLWKISGGIESLDRRKLDYWRAKLNMMRNGQLPFYGYSLSRCWPMSYPRGSWPTGTAFSGTTASVYAIGADNSSFRLTGLPSGFRLLIGDFFQVGIGDLYEVYEDTTASSAGVTPFFQVGPNIWPGTATGTAVSVKRPHCLMTFVPGSVSTPSGMNGRGSVSFDAVEYR